MVLKHVHDGPVERCCGGERGGQGEARAAPTIPSEHLPGHHGDGQAARGG